MRDFTRKMTIALFIVGLTIGVLGCSGSDSSSTGSGGFGDAHDDRLKFFNVIGLPHEIQAETVPLACMPVIQMLLQAIAQVSGQSGVVQTLTLVESIDSVLIANKTGNLFAEVLKDLAGCLLQIAGH